MSEENLRMNTNARHFLNYINHVNVNNVNYYSKTPTLSIKHLKPRTLY